MVEFINPFTRTSFWVADDRVDEYKAAGYPLAANLEKPKVEKVEAEKTEEEPVKPTRRVTRRR